MKAEYNIPEYYNVKDLAKDIAKILINDYGTHNYDTFINELKSELNLQNLQVWSNFPGVKHKDCMKSIKLFTEKVMPHFKDDLDTEVKKVS